MTKILIIFVFFLIALALIIYGSMWYMKAIIRWTVENRLRDLENITATGAIPEGWSRKYHQQLIQLLKEGKMERVRDKQKLALKTYKRKLKRLMTYTKQTNLVDSETTRLQLLDELSKAGTKWEWEVQQLYGTHNVRK